MTMMRMIFETWWECAFFFYFFFYLLAGLVNARLIPRIWSCIVGSIAFYVSFDDKINKDFKKDPCSVYSL